MLQWLHPVLLVAHSEVPASFCGACRVFVPFAFMVSGDLRGCRFGRREVVACHFRALNCGMRGGISRQLLQMLFCYICVGVGGFASGTTRVLSVVSAIDVSVIGTTRCQCSFLLHTASRVPCVFVVVLTVLAVWWVAN